MITRKQLNGIAKSLRKSKADLEHARTYETDTLYRYIVEDLADYLATENPRFDYDQWYKAVNSD